MGYDFKKLQPLMLRIVSELGVEQSSASIEDRLPDDRVSGVGMAAMIFTQMVEFVGRDDDAWTSEKVVALLEGVSTGALRIRDEVERLAIEDELAAAKAPAITIA